MTGAEFLESIWDLEEDIRVKEEEYAKIKDDIKYLKAVDTTKDKVDGGVPMDLADKIGKLEEVKDKLNAEWGVLICRREQARNMINLVQTGMYRSILKRRYINHNPWSAVARKMGFREDYIRHMLAPAIVEFETVVEAEHPGFFKMLDFK